MSVHINQIKSKTHFYSAICRERIRGAVLPGVRYTLVFKLSMHFLNVFFYFYFLKSHCVLRLRSAY